MKNLNWWLIGLVAVCLTMVPLAGCIGVSQSEYEALQTEYEALQAEQASLVAENTSVKGQLEEAQSDLASVQADYDALQADYDTLNADYEAANRELAEIKEVYPPRYFNNDDELEDWVTEAAPEVGKYIDIWRQHLELQKMALADGYIWSVSLDRDAKFISVVIAGDSVYWVWNDGYMEWVGSK